MKVENMVKLKQKIDYKSSCRRLDIELDKLTMEYERQQKEFQDDIEGLTTEGQHRISEALKGYSDSLEVGLSNVCRNLIVSGNLYYVFESKLSNSRVQNCHTDLMLILILSNIIKFN